MTKRAIAVALLGASAMVACSLDAVRDDSATESNRQSLVATNITLQGSVLATNTSLVLRVVGPGYSATVVGIGTLPPIFSNGTYTVATASGNAFGTFIVENGVVVTTTGAVTMSSSGLGFDLGRLARVEVPFAALSVPAGRLRGGLGSDSGRTSQTLTAFLPDGPYTVTGPREQPYGGFVVQSRAVTTTSGGLMPTSSGVAFDATKLPSILLNARTLSDPPQLQELALVGLDLIFLDEVRFLAPTGTFQITDKGPDVYGSFTVNGPTVTSMSGALKQTATGVEIDSSKLAAVTIPLSGLSIQGPGAFMQTLMSGSMFKVGVPLFGGMFTFFRDPTFRLPDGHFEVNNGSGRAFQWGSFDVADRAVVAGTGAFRAGPGGSLQIHSCALSAVTIQQALPIPGFGTLFQIPEVFNGGVFTMGGTFLLPPGAYTITSFSQPGSGSFVVPQNGAITNVVKPPYIQTLTGSIGSCLVPPTTTCVGTPLSPVTLPGACLVTVDNTNRLAGGCSANAGGLTSCTFDGASSKEVSAGIDTILVTGTTADGTSTTCTSYVRVLDCGSDLPVASCVGTANTPATVSTAPGECKTSVDAANGFAGTCASGGTPLASCTFNGVAHEDLGLGDHSVSVAATSTSGTTSSCTSRVRVVDAEPPRITCAPNEVRECEAPLTHVAPIATCADNCSCTTSCTTGDFGLGEHTLSCTASDPRGTSARCDTTITIVDTVAPTLAMNVSPNVLWPPNHELVPITLATSSSDLCDPAPNVTCSASSNEAPLTLGSGYTPADIVWKNGTLFLRAERSGLGVGRVYTITCSAADAAGNTRSSSSTVTVPSIAP